MKDNDLEKTKPIKVLNELSDSRSSRINKEVSRSERFKDALLEAENKESEEAAEEALAEKNIAKAEAYLKKEKEKNQEDDNYLAQGVVASNDEKKNIFDKLKDKWTLLEKKQKIMAIIIIALVVVLIVIFTAFLIIKLTDKEEVVDTPPVVEKAPVIVDNFYYKNGNLYFLDENEKELGTYECKNKDANLCYVDTNQNQDDFDIVKLVDSDNKIKTQRMPIYNNNYVFVYDNKDEKSTEIVLYSMKDKKEIGRYLEVKSYADNYVIVKDADNKYGLLQITEEVKELIKPQYLYLGMIDGQENLIAKNKKGFIVINKKNKVLSSNYSASYKVKNYNDYFVVVLIGDEYSVYDYKGNLLDGGRDFVTVTDKYMVLVDSKKLYIKDNNKIKYNEDAIKLNSKNYVKTYVYDENDSLVETKKSFEVNVKKDELEVVIYKGENEPTTETLNIIEALANEKYDFVNYLGGKLYFYKDEDKEDLIGFYNCSNKNYITKSEDEYSTCFVATDSILEDNDMVSESDITRKSRIPLINDKYAFISDGNNNVVLFDMKEKKTLSSYTKVNTYTENNDNKVTRQDGKVNIIALNKKGKYGMITINGSNVSSTYSFNYNKLEMLGNYILAQDTSNKWKIIYDKNDESVVFDGKIRGYSNNKKYFKTMTGNKYSVYNADGTTINSNNYLYVELYDTYFAGVSEKRELSIYDYEGNVLTSGTVSLGNYKFYATANPAFKVKKSGDNYVVSVFDGTAYKDTTLTPPVVENAPDTPVDGENNDNGGSSDVNQ